MIYIEKDNEIVDSFQVLDKHGDIVTGLVQGDFTIKLYNPSKDDVANVSAGVVVAIEELGDGFYRTSFTPDTLGAWNLIISHATYIEDGVGEDYFCLESLGGVSQEIEDMIKKILGLSQSNYRIINPEYDKAMNLIAGIIKTYPTATDLENDTNTIGEYSITAVFNRKNQMTDYKVKEV